MSTSRYNRIFILIILPLLGISTVEAQKTVLKDWEFHFEESPLEKTRVNIPHTWNNIDAFDDESGYKRTKGVYNKTIEVDDLSRKYYLRFDGANQETTLFVNNQKVGEHKGGYTAFSFDISSYLKKGKNELRVVVDNKHNQAIPPLDADFTFYGGIYRNVYLETENLIHFKKEFGTDCVKIIPTIKGDEGSILVSAKIEHRQKKVQNIIVSIVLKSLQNEIIIKERQRLGTSSEIIKFKHSTTFSNPLLWSPGVPNLYELELTLEDEKGNILDIYQHKTGFRTIKIDTKNGLLLNGKPLKLTGVNRHQDWEGYGNAVPVKMQLEDLISIKKMGSNFLRLAHYPQSKEIYETADSLGLILWSEIPVVNKVPLAADFESYQANCIHMQEEHILQNYNHTSLVFIGYMNEIFLRMVFDEADDAEKKEIINNTRLLAQKLEDITRKEAPNHITVMALHGHQIYNETKIAEIPMVIGWNLYYGWYEGKINDLGAFLDNEYRKYPNRPLIISEYGVGADIRLHSEAPEIFDFTEEYQLQYHAGYWKQVHERPFVIGMAVWNFADFGSEFRGNSIPHVNQKGLVNFDRSPKNIYSWYKAVMKPEEKSTKIYDDYDIFYSYSSKKELTIISNQTIRIHLNGELLKEKVPDNGIVADAINLQKGENEIEIFDLNNVLLDQKKIVWKIPELTKKRDVLALNFGANTYFKDSENTIWIPCSKNQKNITLLGDDIKSIKKDVAIAKTENESIYQSAISGLDSIQIKAASGKYKIRILLAQLQKNSISNQKITLEINTHQLECSLEKPFQKFEINTTISAPNSTIDIVLPAENEDKFINGLYIERIL